jgi:hypothetical protein
MRLPALHDRADEGQQIDHPDDRQPQVDVPFRLGVFLALGDAQNIARRRQNDEYLVADEQEIGDQRTAPQGRAAGALNDVQRGTPVGGR